MWELGFGEPHATASSITGGSDALASETLTEVDEEVLEHILENLSNEEIARDLQELDTDDAAYLIAELPEEQRKAFVETELKGKSYQQLSEETGVTIATLVSRKHYAKQRLRQRLRNIYEELIMDKE